MKVIDLLNKIANGEKVPKKIKYGHYVYWYDIKSKDYKNAEVEYTQYLISCKYHSTDFLNDEIEIIEDTQIEDKKIEKISILNTDYYMNECYYETLSKAEITSDIQILKYKLNEIIDRLNDEFKESN